MRLRILFACSLLAFTLACDKSSEADKQPEPVCAVQPSCPGGEDPMLEPCVGDQCTEHSACGDTWYCSTAGTGGTEPQTQPTTNPNEWTAVPAAALTPVQSAQFDKAKSAMKELGKTLVGALSKSIGERGVRDSVEFCQGAAPDVTEKVGKRFGISIGRTSHRLRNPKNAPPEWAAAAVAAAGEAKGEGVKASDTKPATFVGPGGTFGVISPIPTSDLCVQCHGAPENLAEGVGEALEKYYPEDQATGFEPGDLRGWFWVEVPAPS